MTIPGAPTSQGAPSAIQTNAHVPPVNVKESLNHSANYHSNRIPIGRRLLHGNLDSDNGFNPHVGGWMTEHECICVLLTQLRPLIVSNPYVQDYYFAVQWIRRMNAIRSEKIANGQLPSNHPTAAMHIPIPVTIETLNDPNAIHLVTLKRRLVVPLSVTVSFNSALAECGENSYLNDDNGDAKDENKPHDRLNITQSDSNTTLGRPCRANVYRPRLVAELSLASVLSENVRKSDPTDSSVHAKNSEQKQQSNSSDVDVSGATTSTSLKHNRQRRLLLARIERMYSIVLELDEVFLSLARVVIQNDTHNRLVDYRQQLIDLLVSELFLLPANSSTELVTLLTDEGRSFIPKDLFTIRKGLRLTSAMLCYLSTQFTTNYLYEFLRDFSSLQTIWSAFSNDTEITSIFYSSLRDTIYQIDKISNFMNRCFPEAEQPISPESCHISDNLRALMASKLGLSLILCLLDACARASNPADPSDFIRYGNFFSYVNSRIVRSEPVYPVQPFPHLASILVLYIKPAKQDHPLTAEHLAAFCQLIEQQDPCPSYHSFTTSDRVALKLNRNVIDDIKPVEKFMNFVNRSDGPDERLAPILLTN